MEKLKICINPGHGDFDSGAIGHNGTLEKNINLFIAVPLAVELQKLGHKVFLTRQSDKMTAKTVNEDLKHIVDTANNEKCDLLISIHQNSAENVKASGTETFCYLKNRQGVTLSNAVQKFTTSFFKSLDRGIKDGSNLYVIRHSNMTSILIEVLFLSNPREEKILNDKAKLMVYAKGLAAIVNANFKL